VTFSRNVTVVLPLFYVVLPSRDIDAVFYVYKNVYLSPIVVKHIFKEVLIRYLKLTSRREGREDDN